MLKNYLVQHSNPISCYKIIEHLLNDIFTINTPFSLKDANIQIYAAVGKAINYTSFDDNQINSSTWTKGIYFISIKNKDKSWTNKIIKS
ncbi:MAG: hypothetical protein ACI94Y_002547 [Maribacter sp.]|jgi:hypothetical protein